MNRAQQGGPVAAPGIMLLEARDVAAGYGKPVVGPVSFGVEPGQVLGVWGPNGAGKSTLLGALAGAVRVFSGEVRRPAGVRIAYQRQSPLALEGLPLTGRELLRLTGAPADGLPGWLAPLVARRLDSLSQGQRQWMQIWASLGAGARVVLLDEPTNNLDPSGIEALQRALAPAAADRAVVVVSHDRRFLQAVSTHLLELGGGSHHGA